MELVGLDNTTYNWVEFIDYGQVGYGVFKLGIQNDLGVFWIHLWYVKSTFENNYWNFEDIFNYVSQPFLLLFFSH